VGECCRPLLVTLQREFSHGKTKFHPPFKEVSDAETWKKTCPVWFPDSVVNNLDDEAVHFKETPDGGLGMIMQLATIQWFGGSPHP